MSITYRAILIGLAVASMAMAQSGEFRGMWITRFEWPDRNPDQCKAKIDEMMKTLAEHNFNAVVFQVRGQCDTFYPSPEEPWSPIISPDGSDPGWDPMAYAIKAAHANDLEFHAYINTHVAWSASKKAPPVAKSHVYYRHFDESDPSTCDWSVHDQNGKPAGWAGSYLWIAPGVPAAQAYTRRQVMYVVNNYDVDGVHFDRIRTVVPNVSYDPVSVARAEPEAEGNPAGLDFGAWTTDQINRFVCDMYAQIMEVRPAIKVSSAPLGLVSQDRYPGYPAGFHYGVTRCRQDAQAWMASGAMDFICPQIYWADGGKPPNYSDILPDWIEHSAGRHVYVGQSMAVGVNQLVSQVKVTREMGGLGNVVFSYGSFNSKGGFTEYTKPGSVYETRVATPPMPWKDSPTEGIILGTITDPATGEPIVDAQVRRSDSDYVALSSADGLYSLLKVPPGNYTLTITKSGFPEQQIASVASAAGEVTRLDVRLGEEPMIVASAEEKVEPLDLVSQEPEESAARDDQQAAVELVQLEEDQEPAVYEETKEQAYSPPAPQPPLARQTYSTAVEETQSGMMRFMLIGLMVAGLAVGGLAVIAALNAKRKQP